MLVLGIESSCDETACAIVRDGREVLANEIASQVEEHARFGGVVPEIASRQHLAALFPLVSRALDNAALRLEQIDLIAVTRAPGLIGPLLVGLSGAKALALSQGLPLIGVNHLAAHLLAARLLPEPPDYPFLGLIASGGHSALYRVDGPTSFTRLGATRDDAAGEAYDKVAKLLGLGYPGGVVIDRLARSGNPRAIPFPRALRRKDTLDFSFSGLKTAVRTAVAENPPTPEQLPDLCASFQEAAVDTLLSKCSLALAQTKLTRLVLAGGVAANSRLREKAQLLAKKMRIELFLPTLALCTDNAAMVAACGYERYRSDLRDELLTLNAAANEHGF